MNTSSPDSVAVAMFYAQKHRLPRANSCQIACSTEEECSLEEFRTRIKLPIRNHISSKSLEIDYIVLTKGIPIRTREGDSGGLSVDSRLTMLDGNEDPSHRTRNPFFGANEAFTHRDVGIYLVSRIDGYTRSDCLNLVDRALEAKPEKGLFLFNVDPGHENGGYKAVNDGMRQAHTALSAEGYSSILESNGKFAGNLKRLMGYYSWGSNDKGYDAAAYRSLSFLPGAIAETAVSTSGRTFRDPNAPGQSLIADLIVQGVTGCKGYVSEPFADSMAVAHLLFARYTSGYGLVESFYMASQWLCWKDIVIGDPLCAPYLKK